MVEIIKKKNIKKFAIKIKFFMRKAHKSYRKRSSNEKICLIIEQMFCKKDS